MQVSPSNHIDPATSIPYAVVGIRLPIEPVDRNNNNLERIISEKYQNAQNNVSPRSQFDEFARVAGKFIYFVRIKTRDTDKHDFHDPHLGQENQIHVIYRLMGVQLLEYELVKAQTMLLITTTNPFDELHKCVSLAREGVGCLTDVFSMNLEIEIIKNGLVFSI